MKVDLHKLIELRHSLHAEPELSNQESKTARLIKEFMEVYQPKRIIEQVGGHGLIAVFEGNLPGPGILIRAELDALPIYETNDMPYRSRNHEVSHKCGHDGHMSMVAGLAPLLKDLPRGKVFLLFQPAEETGEGAKRVLEDPRLKALNPSFVFALHNIPGRPLHQILLKEHTFNAASKGMIITLDGITSHAAEPENGNSPAPALAWLMKELPLLVEKKEAFKDFVLITLVHALLGEIAFGTNPSHAELRLTLRAFEKDDMRRMTNWAVNKVMEVAELEKLRWKINWAEEFAPTLNDEESVGLVRKAAQDLKLDVVEMKQPLKWSEDFGYFTHKYP
ncbi:MAG: amidohydrolase, partial [Bacteroidota bacterium]